jgi:hypothetical protein
VFDRREVLLSATIHKLTSRFPLIKRAVPNILGAVRVASTLRLEGPEEMLPSNGHFSTKNIEALHRVDSSLAAPADHIKPILIRRLYQPYADDHMRVVQSCIHQV